VSKCFTIRLVIWIMYFLTSVDPSRLLSSFIRSWVWWQPTPPARLTTMQSVLTVSPDAVFPCHLSKTSTLSLSADVTFWSMKAFCSARY